PQLFDVLGILSDETAGALIERIGIPTLTYARNSGVGLDGDNGVRLIEEWIVIRRRVSAHARDFHLRHRRIQQRQMGEAGRGSRSHGLQEGSSVHRVSVGQYIPAKAA